MASASAVSRRKTWAISGEKLIGLFETSKLSAKRLAKSSILPSTYQKKLYLRRQQSFAKFFFRLKVYFFQVEMLSIGTLVAYTMVAIAVLVTRYTPGVQSVTMDKDSSKEKTNKWLKTMCCRPGEGEDDLIPEVSYQQVQYNDEDSPTSAKQPDGETSFRARVGTFVLTLSITAFTICLTRSHPYLAKGQIWAILLCCIFGLMIVASLMFITRQPRNSATFPFMVPGVPIIPALTIFFNVLLLVMLNHWTYIRFSVWMALGEYTRFIRVTVV